MAPQQNPDSANGPAPQEQEGTSGPSAVELEDRWLRAVAELDNLRKRHARELESVRAEERRRVSAAWLPVLDHLDAALEHADADPGSIVEGVRAVRDQAVGLLAGLGYPRDEELGVPFDPRRHEVVSVVRDPDAEPGTVVRMLRPGYGEAGRQLRPGAVAVVSDAE